MADETKPNTPIPAPQMVINQAFNMLYSNSAIINITQADIQVAFSAYGRPAIAVAMSLPMAKHLQKSLLDVLNNYEAKTGTTIGDLAELGEKLKNNK
jgi:hypothetical protein